MEGLSAEENDLVAWQRQEARELKDCFTRYSFQAIAISAAALALIARFQSDEPATALPCILITALILSVARLGTYKYQSANRLYGYELHLTRATRLLPSQGWTNSMRRVGW